MAVKGRHAAQERTQWQHCVNAARDQERGQESEKLCLSQMVSQGGEAEEPGRNGQDAQHR